MGVGAVAEGRLEIEQRSISGSPGPWKPCERERELPGFLVRRWTHRVSSRTDVSLQKLCGSNLQSFRNQIGKAVCREQGHHTKSRNIMGRGGADRHPMPWPVMPSVQRERWPLLLSRQLYTKVGSQDDACFARTSSKGPQSNLKKRWLLKGGYRSKCWVHDHQPGRKGADYIGQWWCCSLDHRAMWWWCLPF